MSRSDDYIELYGGRIERKFLESNISEAREEAWVEGEVSVDMGHAHCIVCVRALPDEVLPPYYKSKFKYLCRDCRDKFIITP